MSAIIEWTSESHTAISYSYYDLLNHTMLITVHT